MRQIGRQVNRLAVEVGNDVAIFQASRFRRTARHNLRDQRTGCFFQTKRLSQVFADLLNHHTEPAAADFAFFFQLIGDIHGHIDRNGKRHAHKTTGAGVDLGVDAHDFAIQIKQRAAGITRVNSHVGLDKRHIVFVRQAAALGADNTGGHRVIKTKR